MTTEKQDTASTMNEATCIITAAGRPVRFVADHSGYRIDFAAGDGHFYGFFEADGRLDGWHTTDEGDCVGPIRVGAVDMGDPASIAAAIQAAIVAHGNDPEACPGCGCKPGEGYTAGCDACERTQADLGYDRAFGGFLDGPRTPSR